MSEAITFQLDGKDVSADIEQLLEQDVSSIEENYGFTQLPTSTNHFRVKKAEVEVREMAVSRKTPDIKVKRACFVFEFEVRNCLAVKDPSVNPQDLIGAIHYESWPIFDWENDNGKVNALFKGARFVPPSGKVKDRLSAFIGYEFVAVVKQRKDRDDPDKIYCNIALREVQPLASGQTEAQLQPPTEAEAETAPAPAAFSLGG